MLFRAQRRMLNTARDEARAILEKSDEKPRAFRSGNLPTFFAEARYSARLIFEEPEIFVFALFQWLVIATAYVMWTQALDWIPDSVWNAISESRRSTDIPEFYLVNLFLLGWSFFVVLVASYPISLLNAAMASAHYLRNSGQSSTAAKCLTLASRNMGRLWAFTTIDA